MSDQLKGFPHSIPVVICEAALSSPGEIDSASRGKTPSVLFSHDGFAGTTADRAEHFENLAADPNPVLIQIRFQRCPLTCSGKTFHDGVSAYSYFLKRTTKAMSVQVFTPSHTERYW